MRTSALRRWLRSEKGRANAAALAAAGPFDFVGPVQVIDASRALAPIASIPEMNAGRMMAEFRRRRDDILSRLPQIIID